MQDRVPYLKEMIPGWAGIAGGLVMVLTLILTTVATLSRDPAPRAATHDTPIHASRTVTFEPVDSGLIVRDVDTGEEVAALIDADGGFIHNVVRVLNKERRRYGVGPDEPYAITGYINGRVSITDLSTGRVIDINAFGSNQVDSFRNLL
ncbi:MAG: photosynthetic complex assembly protein PuhC [Pseudomonadota bacterium]